MAYTSLLREFAPTGKGPGIGSITPALTIGERELIPPPPVSPPVTPIPVSPPTPERKVPRPPVQFITPTEKQIEAIIPPHLRRGERRRPVGVDIVRGDIRYTGELGIQEQPTPQEQSLWKLALGFVPVAGTVVYALEARKDGLTAGEISTIAGSAGLDILTFVPIIGGIAASAGRAGALTAREVGVLGRAGIAVRNVGVVGGGITRGLVESPIIAARLAAVAPKATIRTIAEAPGATVRGVRVVGGRIIEETPKITAAVIRETPKITAAMIRGVAGVPSRVGAAAMQPVKLTRLEEAIGGGAIRLAGTAISALPKIGPALVREFAAGPSRLKEIPTAVGGIPSRLKQMYFSPEAIRKAQTLGTPLLVKAYKWTRTPQPVFTTPLKEYGASFAESLYFPFRYPGRTAQELFRLGTGGRALSPKDILRGERGRILLGEQFARSLELSAPKFTEIPYQMPGVPGFKVPVEPGVRARIERVGEPSLRALQRTLGYTERRPEIEEGFGIKFRPGREFFPEVEPRGGVGVITRPSRTLPEVEIVPEYTVTGRPRTLYERGLGGMVMPEPFRPVRGLPLLLPSILPRVTPFTGPSVVRRTGVFPFTGPSVFPSPYTAPAVVGGLSIEPEREISPEIEPLRETVTQVTRVSPPPRIPTFVPPGIPSRRPPIIPPRLPDEEEEVEEGVETVTFRGSGFPSQAGSVTPSGKRVPVGEIITINPSPKFGWRFSRWMGEGVEGQEYTRQLSLRMDRSKSVIAIFEKGPETAPAVVEVAGIARPRAVGRGRAVLGRRVIPEGGRLRM